MLIQCQRIDDLIDRLGTSQPWSSHVDTGKIVPVAEEDQHKTVFATPFEHTQFWVMPLSLCGAPATFQWMMDHLIEGLEDFTADCLTSSCHLQWKLRGAPIKPTECITHITGGCAPDGHLPVATDGRHAAGTAASRSCNEQEKESVASLMSHSNHLPIKLKQGLHTGQWMS